MIRRTFVHFQHDLSETTEAVLFSKFCMEQIHIKDSALKRYLSTKYEQTGGHLKNAVAEGINAGGSSSDRNTVV